MAFWKIEPGAIDATLADLPGDLPFERLGGKKLARVAVTTDDDLTFAGAEVAGFRQTIYVPTDGIAYLTWSTDMSHRAISAGSPTFDPPLNPDGQGFVPLGSYYPIGISGRVIYRRAAAEGGLTGAFTSINDTIGAGQLSDRKQHYQTIGCPEYPFAVDGGFYYQFSLSLSAHTDAGTMNGVDGAAELTTGGGKNFLLIEYEPGVITVE